MPKKLFLIAGLVLGLVVFMAAVATPAQAGVGKPYCSALGSRSEGWYDSSGVIRWDSCQGQEAVCLYGGTEKEGWYEPSSATTDQIPTLIRHDDDCASAVSASPTVLPMPIATAAPLPYYPCWTSAAGATLKPGASGDSVKELQTALSQDKTLYPEGLVTGYFGNLTKEAVKRLENRLGLPQTGELSENTRRAVFPCYELKVIQPNGGESFSVGESMKIAWEFKAPSVVSPNTSAASVTDKLMALRSWSVDLVDEEATGYRCLLPTSPELKCPTAKKVVYHVQTIPVKGNSGAYEWIIPNTVPESKTYKIRVSLQMGGSSCPPGAYCTLNFIPSWETADESDKVFAISGGVAPTPTTSVTPLPSPVPIISSERLEALQKEITQMMLRLQELLKELEKLRTR